jgi:hypothetical protein
VICVERSTVQPVESNLSSAGFARTVESEMRLAPDAPEGDPMEDINVLRDIRRINGRAPRERDRKDRSGCTDPSPLSTEPVGFLLPAHLAEYRFTSMREAKDKDRPTLVIDFTSAARTSRLELVGEAGGHDDCFDWSGPLATSGRIWVDAGTHDVLRVDRHLSGPVDVRVSWTLQREYNFGAWITLDRDDLTMHFAPVAFTNPDEVILLPESVESLTLVRGGLQSTRRTETFTDYRRFVTAGRIVKDP